MEVILNKDIDVKARGNRITVERVQFIKRSKTNELWGPQKAHGLWITNWLLNINLNLLIKNMGRKILPSFISTS